MEVIRDNHANKLKFFFLKLKQEKTIELRSWRIIEIKRPDTKDINAKKLQAGADACFAHLFLN